MNTLRKDQFDEVARALSLSPGERAGVRASAARFLRSLQFKKLEAPRQPTRGITRRDRVLHASLLEIAGIARGDREVMQDAVAATPDTTESEATESFRLLSLSALARMKLTSFRDKDRTHLRDLIEVGLLDAFWVARLPWELGVRLQHLLDNPEG